MLAVGAAREVPGPSQIARRERAGIGSKTYSFLAGYDAEVQRFVSDLTMTPRQALIG